MITEQKVNELGFKLTDKTSSGSFVHNCHFYESTDTKNLYLTDWDVRHDEPAKPGMCFLFYSHKGISSYQLISIELLNDKPVFDFILKGFIEDIFEVKKKRDTELI
jgi:hypothetical protein